MSCCANSPSCTLQAPLAARGATATLLPDPACSGTVAGAEADFGAGADFGAEADVGADGRAGAGVGAVAAGAVAADVPVGVAGAAGVDCSGAVLVGLLLRSIV